MRTVIAGVLVAASLIAACGGGGDDSPATPATAAPQASSSSSASPATTAAQASPARSATQATASASATAASAPTGVACQSLPSDVRPGTSVVRSLTSGGKAREYRLRVPPGVSVSAKLPVVLNFHGLGSSALEQELYSGLAPLADREGFVLVSPEGTGTPRAFASFRTLPNGTDDVQFTRDLLDQLARDLCIDNTRVYSTGLSNGAFQSSLLGCLLSDRVAAIAPVAGVRFPEDETCGAPVPVLAFHGTADAVVPFEAGNILGVLPWPGARAHIAGWVAHNGCGPQATAQLTTNVSDEAGTACKAEARLVVVKDGGHTWPGAIDVPRLGAVTKEISASEMIWAFFKDKRLTR